MSIRTTSVEEAQKKVCPFIKDLQGNMGPCDPKGCMAWVRVYRDISREDHSGQRQVVLSESSRRLYSEQSAQRSGPPGSTGYWSLPEEGICSMAIKIQDTELFLEKGRSK